MKKQEFRNIIIIVIIGALILGGILLFKGGKKADNNTTTNQNPEEEFVRVEADGTKVNTSSKLAETKKLGDLEISNIELKEKGGESYIQATVKNNGSKTVEDTFLTLKVVDKNQNTIVEVKGYVDSVKSGETYALKIKASADFANAYDFTVSK